MGQGNFVFFDNYAESLGNGSNDLKTTTGHAHKIMLISDAVSAIVGTETDTGSAGFTEVTGGTSYVAGGAAITNAWSETGGIATFGSSGGDVVWAIDGSGPTNVKTALLYDTDAGNTEDLIGHIDLTPDGGTTAVSLQAGEIRLSGMATLFTHEVNP